MDNLTNNLGLGFPEVSGLELLKLDCVWIFSGVGFKGCQAGVFGCCLRAVLHRDLLVQLSLLYQALSYHFFLKSFVSQF